MRDLFLRRQAIFDRRLEVVGYALSAEPSGALSARLADPEGAARLLVDVFIEVGFETLVGDRLAFLALPQQFLVSELESLATILPRDRLVLEVRAPVTDPAVFDALRTLAMRGCWVLADVPALPTPGDPVLEWADMARIDLAQEDILALPERVAGLRQAGLRLLVANVSDYTTFTRCRDLGVDYFQGPFLHAPDALGGRRSPTSRSTLLLLARLHDPEIEFSELESLISLDVSLTYKLLRLVNSAWYGRRKRVSSVREALLLLGTRLIAAWVSLIVLAGVTDKPRELMVTAVVRARMCELIAGMLGRPNRETYFLVGLLSVLDVLLDTPMDELLASLPLTEEVNRALLAHEGEFGEVLESVLAYERGEWDRVRLPEIRASLLAEAFVDAITFAREVELALAA